MLRRELSCFLPVMRNHGDRSYKRGGQEVREQIKAGDDSPCLFSGSLNEPWSYGKQVEGVFRKYIDLRQSIRPYLPALFQTAHVSGDPLVRGLFYEVPQDRTAGNIAGEYMFGSDLLVAPVTRSGQRSRAVYLPGDEMTTWTDLHDEEKTYRGGTTVEADCPLDVTPLFARDGNDRGLAEAL